MQDENEFVKWVANFINSEINVLGHDEDAVAIKQNDNFLVINVDGWVESTDRPHGMSAHACGFRAVANAASDILAKGANPEAMIISMSLSERHQSQMKEIIEGFAEAAKTFNIAYLGGDINTSLDLVIDVTVWGRTDKIIKRNGALPGDKVYWLGPAFGSTAAALGILQQGWIGDRILALEIMSRPKLYFPFLKIKASAAIDCSDGLARSLHLIAKSSQVGIELVELHTDLWIKNVAINNKQDIHDLIFFGGEELGIVFTSHSEDIPKDVVLIGEITTGIGIKYLDKNIDDYGWDHFSSDTK